MFARVATYPLKCHAKKQCKNPIAASFGRRLIQKSANTRSKVSSEDDVLEQSTEMKWHEAAKKAAKVLSGAKSVLVVTGAGISAEAGLPTYRGVSGLYNQDDILIENVKGQEKPLRISIEDCLSSSVFRRHPQVTWKYLSDIERSCRNVSHSKAHALVSKLENFVKPGPVTVMTQNIDGLHEKAGSTDVINIHGTLHKLYCTNPGCSKYKVSFEVPSFEVFESTTDSDKKDLSLELPVCDECQQKTLRPNVVLFDEYLGDETVKKYEERLGASMSRLSYNWPTMGVPSSRLGAPYDVSICIGTSALFAYVNAAALSGRHTIEINPSASDISEYVDIHIQAGATEALEFLFDELGWEH